MLMLIALTFQEEMEVAAQIDKWRLLRKSKSAYIYSIVSVDVNVNRFNIPGGDGGGSSDRQVEITGQATVVNLPWDARLLDKTSPVYEQYEKIFCDDVSKINALPTFHLIFILTLLYILSFLRH